MGEVAKDCFSLVTKVDSITNEEHYVCKALKQTYCSEGKCNFYRPKSEVDIYQLESSIRNYNSSSE